MSRIIPIPTSRVGDLFVRQRLVDQVQLDQLAMFRYQNQVSTGQRLQVPSEDAPAALRAINLQRLLDRKGQIRTNLQASNSYLSAAWDRLGFAATALSDLRGEVVGVAGNVVPDSARAAVVQQIDSVLHELISAGNAKFQGRYLFAGSRSQSQPYGLDGQFVTYSGNEGVLRNYVDLERLFDTNLSGAAVFGGISAAVQGTADLNPHVNSGTLVSTLNGGNGIGGNPAVAIAVNTGLVTETTTVDLRGAVTLGDVARLMEEGAPEGTNVTVEITGTGLVLHSDPTYTIRVSEVAQGRTAQLLGIATDPSAAPTDTLVGLDLNPALLQTTRLADLLGTKAQVLLESAGANNDLLLTASANGTAFDGVSVVFADAAAAGSESASYNAGTKTLTVNIESGRSTANQVAAAITAEGTFTAIVDYHDAGSSLVAGTNPVDAFAFTETTSGGSGEVLDTASGLILTNGGETVTLDISGAETVEDLLNLIHGADLGLIAEVNAAASGINVRSKLSGATFTIGENGGSTATQLGIRTYNGATALAGFNRGAGVPTSSDPANDDLLITARDGTQFAVNLSGATDVGDVIALINAAASGAGTSVVARLAVTGNGIELVDSTPTGLPSPELIVEAVEGSPAAEYLGFVPAGTTQVSTNTPNVDGDFVLQSADRHTLEVDSVFNTLSRLRTAVQNGDHAEIGLALERLDADMDRMNFARGELGARLQNLEFIELRLEDENVQLRAALSDDIDVDLVQAISDLTARQFAFQASLQTAASLMQLSLLNFL
jgi:flagellin-like hook-associated protein FlgL